MFAIIIKLIISTLFSVAPAVTFFIISMDIDDFSQIFTISGISDLIAAAIADIKDMPRLEAAYEVIGVIIVIVSVVAGIVASMVIEDDGIGSYILKHMLMPLGISILGIVVTIVVGFIFMFVDMLINDFNVVLGLLGLLALLGGGTVVYVIIVKK